MPPASSLTGVCGKPVADDRKAGMKGCFPPSAQFAEDCLKSLAERQRKQGLQALPTKVTGWIDTCRKLGLSHV